MLLKILIAVLVTLAVVGGRKRIAALLGAAQKSPSSYRDAKLRAEDPAAAARDVTPNE